MAEIKGSQTSSLVLKVTHVASELVPPTGPTPCGYKELSDANDHRFQFPVILVYGNDEHTGGVTLRGKDPVKMIKEAVAKALVWYYPLAGRRTEDKKGRKLVVKCNGEGIMFVEADAHFTLDDFGNPFIPPFPCLDQLLYHVPSSGSSHVLDRPLLHIQVTRLKCGGFIVGVSLDCVMADATGLIQFLSDVGMLARGANHPRVKPIWDNHLLITNSRVALSRVTGVHDKSDDVKGATIRPFDDDLVHKSFFFGPKEMAVIGSLLPAHRLTTSSTLFEVLTAYIWQSRTIALNLEPNELVTLKFSIGTRTTVIPPLPAGYYGVNNLVVYSTALITANELTNNSLAYALELLTKAKAGEMVEYMKRRPEVSTLSTFVVTDVSNVGFNRLDFGWGVPVYNGLAKNNGTYEGIGFCSYETFVNDVGETGIMVPICLPERAMNAFINEFNRLFDDESHNLDRNLESCVISSSL